MGWTQPSLCDQLMTDGLGVLGAHPQVARAKKGDGETDLQIGHRCAGGGPGALETTQAVRWGPSIRPGPNPPVLKDLSRWGWRRLPRRRRTRPANRRLGMRNSVVAECDEFRMPKVIIEGPFKELDRRHQLRLEPATSLQVFGSPSLTPSAPSRFGKIPKRTFGDRQTFEVRECCPTGSLREAVPNSARVD
jgi:hypothetical protein